MRCDGAGWRSDGEGQLESDDGRGRLLVPESVVCCVCGKGGELRSPHLRNLLWGARATLVRLDLGSGSLEGGLGVDLAENDLDERAHAVRKGQHIRDGLEAAVARAR